MWFWTCAEKCQQSQKAPITETPATREGFTIVGLGEKYDVRGMRGPKGQTMATADPSSYGQANSGWLGNPFVANDAGGKGTREVAVEKFRTAFLAKVEADPAFRNAVLALRGKKIGYYKPGESAIHLHVVQEWLDAHPDETPAAPKPKGLKATAPATGTYEVSTKGDRRFSALNAKLADGRTIEEAYQLDVKGYRSKSNDWHAGKGKPPLTKMSREESYKAYKALWAQWAKENPEAIEDLREKSRGKRLTDSFAKGDINQARALTDILAETEKTPARKKKKQGFLGYKGGFSGGRKGSSVGDGKDIAMRTVADHAIVELADETAESSSRTSREMVGKKGVAPAKRKIVMLARNKERSGSALRPETIQAIDDAAHGGSFSRFVVGDMPGVDTAFVRYLESRGYPFEIYHTGAEPRAGVERWAR